MEMPESFLHPLPPTWLAQVAAPCWWQSQVRGCARTGPFSILTPQSHRAELDTSLLTQLSAASLEAVGGPSGPATPSRASLSSPFRPAMGCPHTGHACDSEAWGRPRDWEGGAGVLAACRRVPAPRLRRHRACSRVGDSRAALQSPGWGHGGAGRAKAPGFGVGRGGARSPEHRWRLGPSSQQQACRGTTSVPGLAEAHPQACVGLALQAAARLPQGATAQRAKRDTTCHTLAWKMFGLWVGVNTLVTRKLKRHEKELVFTLKTL